ncbi:interleukin-12 subunit beta [Chanos chanos]|uniref:Interleukin-12 subunit beta n=1 Tax=Chanos chanos TaxID=29144 RepID=A0A6J2W411_CHACN|nr:interleukin-12 subunit beta-like [Chanos chanos]
MPNVLVVKTDLTKTPISHVSLRCGAQLNGTEVHWEKNGVALSQMGNHITVTVVEMHGGNFTCYDHTTGSYLSHTLVLVQPLKYRPMILVTSHHSEHIECVSKNYSGEFHCSWKWNPIRNGMVVSFSAMRSSGEINCSLDSDGSGLTCMDPNQCPYAEEKNRIDLTLFVRNKYRLEEYSRRFYLHEIVKPEKVNISRVKEGEFEWHYPDTWNRPCSYFSLVFEVKVVPLGKSCGHEGGNAEVMTDQTSFKVDDNSAYTFCVRAKDPLTSSAIWSDWSHYE